MELGSCLGRPLTSLPSAGIPLPRLYRLGKISVRNIPPGRVVTGQTICARVLQGREFDGLKLPPPPFIRRGPHLAHNPRFAMSDPTSNETSPKSEVFRMTPFLLGGLILLACGAAILWFCQRVSLKRVRNPSVVNIIRTDLPNLQLWPGASLTHVAR